MKNKMNFMDRLPVKAMPVTRVINQSWIQDFYYSRLDWSIYIWARSSPMKEDVTYVISSPIAETLLDNE